MVYIDDLQIIGDNEACVDGIQEELSESFSIKIIGEPAKFLGCAITRNREAKTVTISQNTYTKDLLTDFGMAKCSGANTPIPVAYRSQRKQLMAPQAQLTTEDKANAEKAPSTEYATLCGSVNWLVTKTRPDITHTVFRLQRHMQNPTQYDIRTAKTLLRYLQRNRYDLKLGINPDEKEKVYVDAAHQDLEDGRSTEGYVIYYTGSPIAWGSKKQPIIAPSTTITEFVVFDRAVKEALYIRKLAVALELRDDDTPIQININGNNAVDLIAKVGFSNTLKWIDNRFYFVKDILEAGKIAFQHINGIENPADGFTKPLQAINHEAFRKRLKINRR